MLDLDPSEKLVLKVRRHKLVLFFQSFFLTLFVIVPPLLFWVSQQNLAIRGNNLALFASLYSAILLIGWITFFIIWTNYYLDVLIVTDKKVIFMEQKGFFKREIATLRLDRIQDITVTVTGIIATFLDYGTLRIQSAGETPEFVIASIPKPIKVKAIIYELQGKILSGHGF